ncbi:MAG: hypothetical protein AM325_010130 [Candidatus Thorarchaeota archaeon SMTZ1-45]
MERNSVQGKSTMGAVTGALIALGLKYGGPDSTKVNEVAMKFLEEFAFLNGTVI